MLIDAMQSLEALRRAVSKIRSNDVCVPLMSDFCFLQWVPGVYLMDESDR